jgi:hypothetical protein
MMIVIMMIGIRKKISHVMHYNSNYLYSQQSLSYKQFSPAPLHWASEASTSLKESLLLLRDTTPAAPQSMFPHGHGLVEVTFTLSRHDGDIICISGSDGGGKGRFSYVDMMNQTC